MSEEPARYPGAARRAAAVGAVLAAVAIGAPGCGSQNDLENAVSSARSIQSQASTALNQAQQQAQQQQQQNGGSDNYGY